MYSVLETDVDGLKDVLSTFALRGPLRNTWQAIVHVKDTRKSENAVVTIEVQIDKTYKHHLTIQAIEVDPEYQRQGLCRACIKALKEASVAVGRVAHVESVLNEHLCNLLLYEDFYPSDDGYCFEWKPLTLQSWVVDTGTFRNHSVGYTQPNTEIINCVTQLTQIWKASIPGMELFTDHAKWFEPETDLEKISAELGIPIHALVDFRRDKACFGMSSFFTDVYSGYYVIEGLAVDSKLGPLALEHACLCRIKKGEIFAFDLVRRSHLFIYGVVVRMDMKRKMNKICKDTWAGYSVINGLNYIKNVDTVWN